MEVLTNSVNEWNIEIAEKARSHKDWNFALVDDVGPGYYMALTVAIIYGLAGLAFFISSHKQKGSRAATTELEIEDRPIEVGR